MRVQRKESSLEILSLFHSVSLQRKESVTNAVLGKCVSVCSRINSSSLDPLRLPRKHEQELRTFAVRKGETARFANTESGATLGRNALSAEKARVEQVPESGHRAERIC